MTNSKKEYLRKFKKITIIFFSIYILYITISSLLPYLLSYLASSENPESRTFLFYYMLWAFLSVMILFIANEISKTNNEKLIFATYYALRLFVFCAFVDVYIFWNYYLLEISNLKEASISSILIFVWQIIFFFFKIEIADVILHSIYYKKQKLKGNPFYK